MEQKSWMTEEYHGLRVQLEGFASLMSEGSTTPAKTVLKALIEIGVEFGTKYDKLKKLEQKEIEELIKNANSLYGSWKEYNNLE